MVSTGRMVPMPRNVTSTARVMAPKAGYCHMMWPVMRARRLALRPDAPVGWALLFIAAVSSLAGRPCLPGGTANPELYLLRARLRQCRGAEHCVSRRAEQLIFSSFYIGADRSKAGALSHNQLDLLLVRDRGGPVQSRSIVPQSG